MISVLLPSALVDSGNVIGGPSTMFNLEIFNGGSFMLDKILASSLTMAGTVVACNVFASALIAHVPGLAPNF